MSILVVAADDKMSVDSLTLEKLSVWKIFAIQKFTGDANGVINQLVLFFSGAKPTTLTPKATAAPKAPVQKKQESSSSEESSSDSEDEPPAKV